VSTDDGKARLLVEATALTPPPELSPEIRMGNLGEWWRRKNRGRGGTLRTPGDNPINVIQVTGDDQLATQMTITCALSRADGEGVGTFGDFPPVVGLLRWGNDGFQSQAEIDFVNGAQITAAGAFFDFTARIDADAPNLGDPMPAVNVGAHLGYNTPATRRVQRTRYFSLLANPAAVVLPIPPFSESIRVQRSGGGGSVLIEQLDRSGAVIADASSSGMISLEIPNDARLVRVTNLEAVPMVGRLVFGMWL
jgi:hypothetical protein